jgi:hypothetical protein
VSESDPYVNFTIRLSDALIRDPDAPRGLLASLAAEMARAAVLREVERVRGLTDEE